MTFNVSEICSSDSHSSDLTSCHFSKSALLATSSSDQTIKIWSVGEENQELHEIATLKGHKYGVNFCQFSPQGTLLASGSTDSTTIIWDVKTGDNLCTLVQPSGFAVRVCKFCPNSAFLATAGDDDLVCIWDISVKQLVRTITSHQATIFSLDFSPDGHILISSDVEGRCRVWATQPGHHTLLAGVEEAHDLGERRVVNWSGRSVCSMRRRTQWPLLTLLYLLLSPLHCLFFSHKDFTHGSGENFFGSTHFLVQQSIF